MNNTLYRVDDRDWILNGQEIERPKTSYNDLRRAFWQSEVSFLRNTCSIHACITVITNQFKEITFSLEDRVEIVEYALKWKTLHPNEKNFDPSFGWYMIYAVKCVAEWCRKNKGIDLAYYRVNWKQYRKLTNLDFGVVCGFYIKEGFGNDRFDDGVLNGSAGVYGEELVGHLISEWSLKELILRRKMIYVDNYEGKHKYNETGIDHRFLAELVADGVMFPNGYIYTLK